MLTMLIIIILTIQELTQTVIVGRMLGEAFSALLSTCSVV